MKTQKKKITLVLAFLGCLGFRLIPFRAPNVEPILGAQMPASKIGGATLGFFFGFLSIILYDLITGTAGVWTLITATTYGLLGIFSALYFKNRIATRKNFVTFAILGTLFYDAVTGFTVGPLFFHQNFSIAFAGQIPFTALHLLGSVAAALFVSPALYGLLNQQEKQSTVAHAPSLQTASL